MNDLEICKRIAEIEDVKVFEDKGLHGFQLTRSDSYEQYNPLTDDALCFQLMVKYFVSVDYNHTRLTKDYIATCPDGYGYNSNPNKAILLCIIEAHNER